MSVYKRPQATGQVFRFEPCAGDRFWGTGIETGTLVRKCAGPGVGRVSKPFAYVERADNGQFLCMVLVDSLRPTTRAERTTAGL